MSPEERKALWLRLRHSQFEDIVPPQLKDRILHVFGGADASVYAFANKLCRKLGWKTAYALRAIAEYKKYLYLGATASFHVTPPKPIDQVWHEHLLFTRGYDTFCHQVLGRRFDHYPELIPEDDQTELFQTQYLNTLALYEREFHASPPGDIWGTPKFKKKPDEAIYATADGGWSSDGPALHEMFDGSTGSHAEFNGFHGGESGGAGASAGWSDASDAGGHGGDAGGADGGAGDGGGSCGSGCSSGCSGGCSS